MTPNMSTREELEAVMDGRQPVRGAGGRIYYVRYNENKEELEEIPGSVWDEEQIAKAREMAKSLRPKKTFGEYFVNNLADIAYGANRTVNGLTFGGLDKLGDKYSFDSSMSDYARLRGGNIRQLGNIAETGGSLLPFMVGGIASVNWARPYYNSWRIGRAYDRLKDNPYEGSGQDVITKMKNHNGETVMLQRGEAIPGENGRVITHGKTLQRQTGTQRNYGLNKAIYKHDMDKFQVTRMPRMLKERPVSTNEYGQHIYENMTPKGNVRLVSTSVNGRRIISSMYIVDR